MLFPQPEMIQEKETAFHCILRMSVFAQMSRKLQTDRHGVLLVEEKEGEEIRMPSNLKTVLFSLCQSERGDE